MFQDCPVLQGDYGSCVSSSLKGLAHTQEAFVHSGTSPDRLSFFLSLFYFKTGFTQLARLALN